MSQIQKNAKIQKAQMRRFFKKWKTTGNGNTYVFVITFEPNLVFNLFST